MWTAGWCSKMRSIICALFALSVAPVYAHDSTAMAIVKFFTRPLTRVETTAANRPAFSKKFVQIRQDQRLWVEHRPAVNGKPTVFFANGLTWSTRQWQPMVKALDQLDPELGIVLYDMQGMGETLLDDKPIKKELPFDGQVRDLKDLYDALDIEGPKVLAGLSYGGAVTLEYLARYPDDFEKGIAMAPFLERLPDQDQWIRNMIKVSRSMFPMNPHTDEELYDYWLRQLVYMTYPSAEPIILENPYKLEAVFRMVQGAKNWRALETADRLPRRKLHLLAGQEDPFVRLPWLETFWRAVPEQSRASFLILRNTTHKLPQERPDIVAAWLMHILSENPNLNRGLIFEGDPYTKTAKSGNVSLPLKKVNFCELTMRALFRPQ